MASILAVLSWEQHWATGKREGELQDICGKLRTHRRNSCDLGLDKEANDMGHRYFYVADETDARHELFENLRDGFRVLPTRKLTEQESAAFKPCRVEWLIGVLANTGHKLVECVRVAGDVPAPCVR